MGPVGPIFLGPRVPYILSPAGRHHGGGGELCFRPRGGDCFGPMGRDLFWGEPVLGPMPSLFLESQKIIK